MRLPIIGALAGAALIGLCGASSYDPWHIPDGAGIVGTVIYCATGNVREADTCGGPDKPLVSRTMPFARAGDPFILEATATPQQYLVTQPDKSSSYRAINPCQNADIRVKTAAAIAMPISTEPTQYPGVARVTSATTTVTATTGTRFMGRYGETLASTLNPMGGPQRIISVIAVPIPGATSSDVGTCPFELQYGVGG